VTRAARDAAGDDLRAAVEVHEDLVGHGLAQDVAMAALERGAADDAAGARVPGEPGADDVQPREAVPVVQGDPRRHLREVLRGVEVVGVGEGNP